MADFVIEWEGDELTKDITKAIIKGLNEFGMRHATESKGILRPTKKGIPGGVITGTLRRSIHSASPAYDFPSDNVKPAKGTPNRTRTGGSPKLDGDLITVVVGSGQNYAAVVERFYAYMERGFNLVEPQLESIIRKHVAEAGLS